ncbi:uncharacterized protein LOC116209934 isoform X2 [Punica granatum]|uniref:Uncharacterized protein LOC116209934 isoform X2 n=1 Tax=Punica granatum TaxID=22663 RepID=A0A6P8E3R3_PUNGR|nr:uncharacterized protein LOC116209934 isoform X2 [Punica granatum]
MGKAKVETLVCKGTKIRRRAYSRNYLYEIEVYKPTNQNFSFQHVDKLTRRRSQGQDVCIHKLCQERFAEVDILCDQRRGFLATVLVGGPHLHSSANVFLFFKIESNPTSQPYLHSNNASNMAPKGENILKGTDKMEFTFIHIMLEKFKRTHTTYWKLRDWEEMNVEMEMQFHDVNWAFISSSRRPCTSSSLNCFIILESDGMKTPTPSRRTRPLRLSKPEAARTTNY